MSSWVWQLGLSGMRDRFGIFGVVIRIWKLSLLLVMTFRMPNKHFWPRCRGRLITIKEWIWNFESSFASLIWSRLSILSYSFTPLFFYFDYFMQGNVWIEDVFQEIWLTIPKHYSEKQEPSSRRHRQHFSTKLHPIQKIVEVSSGTCL